MRETEIRLSFVTTFLFVGWVVGTALIIVGA